VPEHHLQTPITTQPLKHIPLDTVDIVYGRKEPAMLAADLVGLHTLNVGQIDEDALVLTIELLLNHLPQTLRRDVRDDIIGRIITGRLMLNRLQRLFILARLP